MKAKHEIGQMQKSPYEIGEENVGKGNIVIWTGI